MKVSLGLAYIEKIVLTSMVGEGYFDTESNRPSGAATPIPGAEGAALGPKGKKPRKNASMKKAKTAKQRLAMADGDVDMG